MQHVRVAEHDVRAVADRSARVLGRVAVVGEHAELERRLPGQPLGQAVQLGQLVLGQRLGRKQVQGAARRIGHDGVQDGHVVAERLAGRRRGRHDHVASRQGVRHRLGLVRVDLIDAARGVDREQPRVDGLRKRGVTGRGRGEPSDGRDAMIGAIDGVGRRARRQLPQAVGRHHPADDPFQGRVPSNNRQQGLRVRGGPGIGAVCLGTHEAILAGDQGTIKRRKANMRQSQASRTRGAAPSSARPSRRSRRGSGGRAASRGAA